MEEGVKFDVLGPEEWFKRRILEMWIQVASNYNIAHFRRDKEKERIFKISLIGLYSLLLPKRRYLSRDVKEVFDRCEKYIEDGRKMSWREAIELYKAVGRAIEQLGISKVERPLGGGGSG